MAKENVKAFLEALTKDEAVQKILKEKEKDYAGIKDARDSIIKEILLPVAEKAGYSFTEEELKEYEKNLQPQGELDEDELEAVAGGVENWGACSGLGAGYGDSCFIIGFAVCVVAGVDVS